MAESFAYKYARIDETGYCREVVRQSKAINADQYDELIAIPSYNEKYLEKYYNLKDGKWYMDSKFTKEWTP